MSIAWRNMASAPLDGTEVLLRSRVLGVVHATYTDSAWRSKWNGDALAPSVGLSAWSPLGGSSRHARARFVKTGHTYRVLSVDARVQTRTPLVDMDRVVVYVSEDDGETWVRPVAEFHDGRFDILSDDGSTSIESVGARLSRAQEAVAELVSQGLQNKTIAHRMGITEGTVKTHVSEAIRRLGATNRVGLAVAYARLAERLP